MRFNRPVSVGRYRPISPCAGSGEPELQRTIAYDNFAERYARLQSAHTGFVPRKS